MKCRPGSELDFGNALVGLGTDGPAVECRRTFICAKGTYRLHLMLDLYYSLAM